MLWAVKTALGAMAALLAAAFFIVPLWGDGYISRELVAAVSPDGSLEAVCRGWYPDQTDYELWIRPKGGWFGRRIGKVGGESQGRCGAVAWSPDGTLVAAGTLSGSLYVYDGRTFTVRGHQWLHEVGEPGTVPTPRLLAAIAFVSADTLRVRLCNRISPRPRDVPYHRCGPNVTITDVALNLEPARGLAALSNHMR